MIPTTLLIGNLLLGCIASVTSAHVARAKTKVDQPTVTIINGSYYGRYNPTYDQDEFLGVPFAQPPVNDLRLHVPVPLNTTWEGTRNATQYGYACYGYGSDNWVFGDYISEDCLTLNVVRPAGTNPDSKLPVGVWIHGGGATTGASLDPRYNASFIVQQSVEANKPFIFISINYRLHAFGFLFGSTILESGHTNLGFRDQRLALHWLQENIAAFGGDPSKVTIWGQSAGAASVGMQAVAYNGRDDGLFRSIILQSGGLVPPVRLFNATAWDPTYDNITAATNCSSATDTLACLRRVPIEQLNAVFNSSVTARAPFWGVRIDNDFLVASGAELLMNGSFVRVPMLNGANFDEGTAYPSGGINTTEQFLANIKSLGPDNATALTIAALYPDIPAIGIPATLDGRPPPSLATLGSHYKRVAAYNGDLRQHAPRRLMSQVWAANNLTSYSYHFNVRGNGAGPEIGVTHSGEVPFVFYNIDGSGYDNDIAEPPFEGKPESYTDVARIVSRSWISFIVDGDPNSSAVSKVHWPAYTLENPRNMVFDANLTDLALVEPDTYRPEGIAYLGERLASVYGR